MTPLGKSWVASANGHTDFPIQNLPVGVFSPPGSTERRAGIAIGDMILDLSAASEAGFFAGASRDAAEAALSGTLNKLFALGHTARQALRARASELLDVKGPDSKRIEGISSRLLQPRSGVRHASSSAYRRLHRFLRRHSSCHKCRKSLQAGQSSSAEYKHVPIGYHGHSSSIVPSGTPVRHPSGQLKDANSAAPTFGPSRRLDYELELGIWIGPEPSWRSIPIDEAERHVAGFCLLNDWSARDIQSWEYQPLGPFLSKNFATTISPWVITPEALAPFRAAQFHAPMAIRVPCRISGMIGISVKVHST